MDQGIWLSENDFISFSELESQNKKELLQEMYGSNGAFGGFDPASFFGILPDPDPILEKTGDGVSVLRSLLADDKVISSVQNRKLGTLKKKNYKFSPGKLEGKELDTESKKLCENLNADLENLNIYNLISQLLDAPFMGQTPVELMWEVDGSQLRIKDLKPRPVEWFAYNSDQDPVFRGEDFLNGDPVIPEKLVIARHFPDAVNPYGLRLLSRCLWPVAIKKGGIQFWTTLCERFGIPWVIGKVPGDQDRQEALTLLTSMVQNAVAVVSGGTEVDVHTHSGKSGDLHSGLVRYCDTQIARVLQGQSLTSEGNNTGSYAEGKVSSDKLGDYEEADEELVCAFFNDFAKVYRNVNSSSAIAPTFSYIEPEDYEVKAKLDEKLSKVGVKFKKIHFVKNYNLSEDEFEVVEKGTSNKEKTELSESSGTKKYSNNQQAIEDLCDDLMEGKDPLSGNEESIIKAIESSESYEEVFEKLISLYPGMDVEDLTESLEKGIFNANLFGQYVGGNDD
ncbi:MAG: DUF935 family protein [Deltaproteobacteria bacterium]|nr:DUF935 family protein [Deltaproteobacteria bacterium]